MERTLRDLLARIDGLLQRIDQQPAEATKNELRALRVAVKGALTIFQGRRSP